MKSLKSDSVFHIVKMCARTSFSGSMAEEITLKLTFDLETEATVRVVGQTTIKSEAVRVVGKTTDGEEKVSLRVSDADANPPDIA